MVRCAVVGAAGYSGAELVSLLLDHESARIVALTASARRGEGEAAPRLSELFPRFRGRCELEVTPTVVPDVLALEPDVVFLATPHEASVEFAAQFLASTARVIDLSGAFRLKDAGLYPRYYGFEHQERGLLEEAVYGLPELHREALRKARLVAAPGCYPTSAILPLRPLVEEGLIAPGQAPIVDSMSGVSGAGRSPSLKTHYCEVSLQPYNVFRHRHNPEIDAYAGTHVVFTPHLVAQARGILSTIHVQLVSSARGRDVERALNDRYAQEPFVQVLPAGQWPATADVTGTNQCHIGWAVDEESGHAILVSAIDNLLKGAAGQALQCMNLVCGLDEATGLGLGFAS